MATEINLLEKKLVTTPTKKKMGFGKKMLLLGTAFATYVLSPIIAQEVKGLMYTPKSEEYKNVLHLYKPYQAPAPFGCGSEGGDDYDSTPYDDDDNNDSHDDDDNNDSGDDDTIDDDDNDDNDDNDDTIDEYDISGWVGGFDIDTGINNIRVLLDGQADNDHETYSNTDGDWNFEGLPQDDYKISFKGLLQGYMNHEAGKLIVDAQKEAQGKLSNLEVKLFPSSIEDFLKCTVWDNGGAACNGQVPVNKWAQKPEFKIYTLEYQSGLPIDPNKVNLVKNVIKNQLNEFVQGEYTFTDADIEEIATIAPMGQIPGKIKIYWDENTSHGRNSCSTTGNEIDSCYTKFNPSVGENVLLQEMSEAMVEGAETLDSTYSDSVFYGDSLNTQYSEEDEMFAAATYGIFSRPIGNEHPDENPLINIFNP